MGFIRALSALLLAALPLAVPAHREGCQRGWRGVGSSGFLVGSILILLGVAAVLPANAAASDSTAPVLRSLTLSPATVDVAGVGADITIQARITDDNSGCDWATLTVQSVETDSQSFSVVLERVSGTAQDGVYRAVGEIGRYATPGTWRVTLMRLDDVASNIVMWNTDSLRTAGLQTDITVRNTPDTVAPVTLCDARGSYASEASITLSATDQGSGVAGTFFRLDGGPDTAGSTVTVTTPGPHELEFWSVDRAGNEETPHKTATFTLVLPAPTVTSFTPTSGPVGTSVTISGTAFSGATAVRFNGTAAGYVVNSATQVTATVPAGATSGAISVTTPAGIGTSTTSYSITTVPTKPAVTKLSPTSGKRGITVTVTGRGFGKRSPSSYVKFGTTKCTKYVSWSATRIKCKVPAKAKFGKVKVTVVTAAGASNTKTFNVKR
jgi:hypothetical protein